MCATVVERTSSLDRPTVEISAAIPAGIDSALADFRQRYPAYDHDEVEQLRSREYSRLDDLGQIYLDYTGGGLHGSSQLTQHMEMLSTTVLGNPHSHNPTSLAMTERVERARAYVLDYFNASSDEYIAIFTSNASGALKHVGESYPFDADSRFLISYDNHNSVNGIREFARSKGAEITYVPVVAPELRIDGEILHHELNQTKSDGDHLFAFPAQSNFSGVQYPLELIEEAQSLGWDVLLDVAAFAPTNRLDLSRWHPDFVAMSFYKMFGYPTGLGCLLVRREALAKLRRPWFAGGTITIASVQGDGHYYADAEAAFEDGTIDYLNIPAVEIGLRHIDRIGIETIHDRVAALTGWLLNALTALRHSNGRPMIQVHGPTDTAMRGGTITISFLDPDGVCLDERRIEELAGDVNISLRTGCFCNPGAGEITHDLSATEMKAFFATGERISFDDLRTTIRNQYDKSVASIRISTGIATNFADVYRFIEFVNEFKDKTSVDVGEHDCEHCANMRDAT